MAFTVTSRGTTDTGTTSQADTTVSSFTASADSLVFFGGVGQLDNFDADSTDNVPTTGDSKTFVDVLVVDGTNAPTYDGVGSSEFRINTGLYRFTEDASPVSRTVTWDATSSSQACFYSTGAFDVTGFDSASPIVGTPRSSTIADQGGSDTVALNLDLVDSLTTGNLVIVLYSASADNGGGFSDPTLGNEAMTSIFEDTDGYAQAGAWYRVITGDEDDTTVRCTDLGQSVGGGVAIGVQIAAEASDPTGSGTPSDSADTASGVGTVESSATGTPSDSADTASGLGTAASNESTASGTPSDTADTASGSGAFTITSTATGAGTDTADTGASVVPMPLKVTATSATSVDLDWTDYAPAAASGYDIVRDGTTIAFNVVGTAYTDNTASESTVYVYLVRPVL